jgi:hypothetical protein
VYLREKNEKNNYEPYWHRGAWKEDEVPTKAGMGGLLL